MAGRNRALRGTVLAKSNAVLACVFVSHRAVDSAVSRTVNGMILAAGFDTYFDEDDVALQQATGQGDVPGVVGRVEQALRVATHLFGIISNATQGSWWVPYEIGAARLSGKRTAHLLLEEVEELPEFIKASQLLLDNIDLRGWIASLGPYHLRDSLKKSLATSSVPRVAGGRFVESIRFKKS